jgi:uncharacterized protein
MTEPVFRHHPDPVATGPAVRAGHECGLCGQEQHRLHRGPVFGEQPGSLSLECIHSGEAFRTLGLVEETTPADSGLPRCPHCGTHLASWDIG